MIFRRLEKRPKKELRFSYGKQKAQCEGENYHEFRLGGRWQCSSCVNSLDSGPHSALLQLSALHAGSSPVRLSLRDEITLLYH